jgi:hypothetical protein
VTCLSSAPSPVQHQQREESSPHCSLEALVESYRLELHSQTNSMHHVSLTLMWWTVIRDLLHIMRVQVVLKVMSRFKLLISVVLNKLKVLAMETMKSTNTAFL